MTKWLTGAGLYLNSDFHTGMKILKAIAAAGVLPLVGLLAGPTTIPLYENFGALTNVPQVDAVAFANYGQFSVSSRAPYETFNTLYYTNRGVMSGIPGFRLDYFDDAGVRRPAARFVNALGASIGVSEGFASAALLRVAATNIVNRGVLYSDNTGLIEIKGHNVDLSRSILSIDPVNYGGGYQRYNPFFDYRDDYGVYDLYWGMGEQDPSVLSSELISVVGEAVTGFMPTHCVTNDLPGECFNGSRGRLPNPYSFVYTNDATPTNRVIQVILVALDDTNITPSVALYPSRIPSNYFTSPAIQLATYLTNNTAESSDLYTLYMIDRLAADTNMVLLSNVLDQVTGLPYRPGPLEFTRDTPMEYAFGRPTNYGIRTNLDQLVMMTRGSTVTNVSTNVESGELSTSIVETVGYEYNLVTNLYASYGAFVTNQVSTVPSSPSSSITNAQGRIVIHADNLNMERTKVRGEGHITINTKHLVSSANASIDVSSILYSLGSTNGNLRLQSLTLPNVQRLSGYVYAWSGVWTNQLLVVSNTFVKVTNTVTDPGGGGDPGVLAATEEISYTNELSTNYIEVGIHVHMLDGRRLSARWPTFLNGLATYSTNVYFDDTMRIVETLRVDAEALTISPNGQLIIGSSSAGSKIRDWNILGFPNLKYLTNDGIIAIPSLGYFGNDRSEPYRRIVNRGTNVARAFNFRADEMDVGGYIGTAQLYELPDGSLVTVPAPGTIRVETGSLKMENGVMDSYYDLSITAQSARLRNYTNQAGGLIEFAVSGDLSDSGPGANSVIRASRGVHLRTKPASGALLGTEVQLSTGTGEAVDCTWSATDLGPTGDGYLDNAAVGWLTIAPGRNGQITFGGEGSNQALYTDYLEFSSTAEQDLEGSLKVNPDFTIYFAAANLPVEKIEGAFPGRVRWVQGFAGPNSSVEVLVISDVNLDPPKQNTVIVNRGFRESVEIDSDGDGIANKFDLDPFSGVRITDVELQGPPDRVAISWNAAGGTSYRVESTTGLGSATWKLVAEYVNADAQPQSATVVDPTPVDGTPRYYRVTYVAGQ